MLKVFINLQKVGLFDLYHFEIKVKQTDGQISIV